MLLQQGFRHSVNDAVYIPCAFRRAVPFRNFNIFIDSHRNRNLRETQQFCHRYLHDDDIHVCKTVKIPVLYILADEGTIILIIQYRATEKLGGKLFVFLILIFWH